MSSQLSTTKKRKLVDSDADEVFVLKKKQEVTASKTVSITIPDFLVEINDENTKKKQIESPTFKIGDKKFALKVYAGSRHVILVGIITFNNEEVVLSGECKEYPTPALVYSPQAQRSGFMPCFRMAPDDYKQWAAHHGDVFKLTVTVTLHLQEGSNSWINMR